MDNTKKVIFSLLGGLLLIIGLAYLLEIFGIGFRSWALFAVGIAVLVAYLNTKIRPVLYVSYFCLTMGAAVFVCTSILPSMYLSFAIVLAIALSLILIYVSSKQSLLLYTSLVVMFFDVWILLANEMALGDKLNGYLFLVAGILLILLFIFENKKLGYAPLVLSLLAYFAGFANLAYSYNLITLVVFRGIVAGLFLLTGGLLVGYVYLSSKSNKKENESER